MGHLRLPAVLLLLLFVLVWAAPAAFAADDTARILQIKGKVRYVESLATYGILSDNGKQYHPIKKLPRNFQKDGLAVVVQAKLRPDLVGARMYGAAIEVLQIEKAELFVSQEEREAIRMLLARMDVFNRRDLAQLRQIDMVARGLSLEQFNTWVAGWGNYTLRYVEATSPGGQKPGENIIAGYCLYSRERTDSMALSGNLQHALMNFTLSKKDGAWVFIGTSAYQPPADQDIEALIGDLQAKAKQRYGTVNLAEWKGK